MKVQLLLTFVLLPGLAFGEDAPTVLRVDRPSMLAVQGDTPASSRVLELPPGYYFPDASFQALDTEVKRLQSTEIALRTENAQLKTAVDSAFASHRFSIKMAVACLVLGAAAGVAATVYLSK